MQHVTRGFGQNLAALNDLWSKSGGGRFRGRQPPSVIERLFGTVFLVGRLFSLSNLFAGRFSKERSWSNFLDVYILAWAALLIAAFAWPCETWKYIAGYRILEIVTNHMTVVFVDSRGPAWVQYSSRRSLLIAIMNVFTVVVAFGLIYGATGALTDGCTREGQASAVTSPIDLLYFSAATIATVGYGDIKPIDEIGRWLATTEIAVGVLLLVCIIPAFLGALGTREEDDSEDRDEPT